MPSLRSAVVPGALVLASLALSHHLVYFLAYGEGPAYARAMTAAGHDRYWASFLLVVGGSSVALVAVSVHQLRRLARLAEARRVGGATFQVCDGSLGVLFEMILLIWLRVAAVTSVAYLLQENLETLTAGVAVPGFSVVTGEHAVAIPVITLVSLALATVRAIAHWRRDLLLARLRSIVPRYRSDARLRRALDRERRLRHDLGSIHRERAPPSARPALI